MAIKILACSRLLLAALFCLSIATVVKADPVVLVSGGAFSGGSQSLKIVGASGTSSEFSFSGSALIDLCGGPSGRCIPSRTDGFTTLMSSVGGQGAFTYGGQTYAYFTVFFSFDDTSLSGFIRVFENGNIFPNNTVLFSFDFVASGIGSTTIFPDGGISHGFIVTQTVQTPEPATILLLASGLPLLLYRRRRLRPHHDSS